MYPYGYGGGIGPSMPPCGYTGMPYGYYPWDYWDYTDFYDYNANLILDDDEVRDLVSDTIDSNPYIPQSDKDNIKVDVKDGVVTLSGVAKNRRTKPLAYADAFWSRGVVDVNNNIKVEEREMKPSAQRAGSQKQRRSL